MHTASVSTLVPATRLVDTVTHPSGLRWTGDFLLSTGQRIRCRLSPGEIEVTYRNLGRVGERVLRVRDPGQVERVLGCWISSRAGQQRRRDCFIQLVLACPDVAALRSALQNFDADALAPVA